MALNLYKAVVNLTADSGLPEDTFNNDWYFRGESAGTDADDDATVAISRVENWYNVIPTGGTKSVSDYLGPQIDGGSNKCSVVVYSKPLASLSDLWGSPISFDSFTIGVPDVSTPLPAEVAACFSFHGDLTDVPETANNPGPGPATIRPASRRRGRLFIGPLNTSAGATQSGTNDSGVTGLFRDTMADAGVDMVALNGDDDVTWVVYSPTAEETHAVVGGFVDSAFDTQRRRGSAALARDSWGS